MLKKPVFNPIFGFPGPSLKTVGVCTLKRFISKIVQHG